MALSPLCHPQSRTAAPPECPVPCRGGWWLAGVTGPCIWHRGWAATGKLSGNTSLGSLQDSTDAAKPLTPFLLFWHSSASLPSHTAARDTQGPVSLSLCSASSLCLAPLAAGCSWSGHSLPCTAIPQAAGRHSFLSWQQHKPFPSSGQACQSLPSSKNTTQPHPERLCSPAIVPPHHTMAKMCPCPTHCGTAAQQG